MVKVRSPVIVIPRQLRRPGAPISKPGDLLGIHCTDIPACPKEYQWIDSDLDTE